MYIPIIIISSAIDIPEASPIIDEEEDMDEGVRDEVVEDDKVIEVTCGKVKDEEDEDKGGVMDGRTRDEDKEVEDNKDKDERAMDKDIWDEGAIRDEDEAVEVPMYTIKYIITTQMNIHCTCH